MSEASKPAPLVDQMTIRDEFAKAALLGLIAEPPWGEGSTSSVCLWSAGYTGSDPLGRFAIAAYAMADAMLVARAALANTERKTS